MAKIKIKQNRYKLIHKKLLFLVFTFILLSPIFGCQTSSLKEIEIQQLTPDLYASSKDDLYAIYRKGLITRHITHNGRLLETVALNKIGQFEESEIYNDVYSDVGNNICDDNSQLSTDNCRHSVERVSNSSKKMNYIWMPVAAPVKYPGLSNDYFCAVAGRGDNPLYYGGMALALFSLEAQYGVSSYSINYARKLVNYILLSEMAGKNGYLIKRASFYDSAENPFGEPVMQGASPEDLVGVMLGLMYYLRVEDTSHPLFKEASALRSRILNRIPRDSDTCIGGYPVIPAKYEHPFMIAARERSYPISQLAFPLYASGGIKLKYKLLLSCQPQKEYENLLKGTAGWSRNLTGIFSDISFEKYATYLTSIILVLNSDESVLSNKAKKNLATVFMEEFIMASYISGLDTARIRNNAYFGVVAKMINKFLNEQHDSELAGRELRNIWDNNLDKWEYLMELVNDTILEATSDSSRRNVQKWQHNLPLMTPVPAEGDQYIYNFWEDHNADGHIGGIFTWQIPYPNRFERPAKEWYQTFPGWDSGDALNSTDYLSDPAIKKYSRTYYSDFKGFRNGYLDKEFDKLLNNNQQVEGTGLGLLFLRMLLTDINPEVFPPPKLPAEFDRDFSVLPWPGVEPMHPQFLHYVKSYSGNKDGSPTDFKITGGTDTFLQIVKGKIMNSRTDFILTYPDEDKTMRLRAGYMEVPLNRTENSSEPSIYVSPESIQWKQFDKSRSALMKDELGKQMLIVAERAEHKSISGKTCKHWLRVSTWRINETAGDAFQSIQHLASWESRERHCNSVSDLDLTVIDNNHVAVVFIDEKNRGNLAVFKVESDTGSIVRIINKRAGGVGQKKAAITSVAGGRVIYVAKNPIASLQYFLYSSELDSNSLTVVSERPIEYDDILDITSLNDHILVVGAKDQHLIMSSYKINDDGALEYRGMFHAMYDSAEGYLLGSEAGWESAVVSPVGWQDRSGFVIAGKGHARELRNAHGAWQRSSKGLKLVYGYIMDDGRPTIESSSVAGNDMGSSEPAFDISESINVGDSQGILSIHKTYDDQVKLDLWYFRNHLERIKIQ